MKKLVFLLCLLSNTLIQAQDRPIVDKKANTTNTINETSEDIEVPFSVIENVPIYKGCDENMGNQALKECMNSQISSLVSKNFNIKLANSLGLAAGKVRISVMFKIDKEGDVVDIKTRAPHPKLEEEAIRIIQLLPKFQKPGMQKGKPVIVPYTIPIVFKIKG